MKLSSPLCRRLSWLLPPLFACIAFGVTVTHGFAPADDSFLVIQNLAIRGMSWENLVRVFTSYDPELYIPLTFISYQLNYLVGGLNPTVYHATNVLLHAINALLVTGVLSILTKNRTAAIIGGILFAVHPLHTEAVAWIAGRKDLLSALFFLLSFVLYTRMSAVADNETGDIGNRISSRPNSEFRIPNLMRIVSIHNIYGIYTLSLLLFLLALLSKVMALTLPVILLLYELLCVRRPLKQSLMRLVPFFILSVIFLMIALGGKERVVATTGLLPTMLMACKSTVFYAQKFIAPYGLGMLYPYRDAITIASPHFFIPLLLVVGALILAWRTWKRNPLLAFGILFTLITLAPTFLNYAKGGCQALA